MRSFLSEVLTSILNFCLVSVTVYDSLVNRFFIVQNELVKIPIYFEFSLAS